MSPISSVPVALRVRAGKIPVEWMIRELPVMEVRDVEGRVIQKEGVERVFCPVVKTTKWGWVQPEGVKEIEGPLELRNELLRMFHTDWNEGAVLSFLERVGAWKLYDSQERGPDKRTFVSNVTFRHRQVLGGRVPEVSMSDLQAEVKHWHRLLDSLHSPVKVQKVFKQPPPATARPHDHFSFAMEASFVNTLPVSLEWERGNPYAVIETITGWELMVAAAWSDAVSHAKKQVCARSGCTTPFTWPRKKKYCRWECGHLEAVKRYKRKKALERQRKIKAT